MAEDWRKILEEIAKTHTVPYVRTGGHVIDALGAMDKLDNPIRAFAWHALHPPTKPEEELAPRLGRAWRQEDEYSWGDVVGIPRTNEEYHKRMAAIDRYLRERPEAATPEFRQGLYQEAEKSKDPWGRYLARGAGRLGLDMILSAWNIIPGLGAVKGAAKGAMGAARAAKVAEVGGEIAKTSKYFNPARDLKRLPAKAFARKYGQTPTEWVDDVRRSVTHELGPSQFADVRQRDIQRGILKRSTQDKETKLAELQKQLEEAKSIPESEGLKGWSKVRGFIGGGLPGSEYLDPILHADVGKHIPGFDKASGKMSGAVERLGERWAASPMGKAFGGPMGGRLQEAEDIIQQSRVLPERLKKIAGQKAAKAHEEMQALFKELGITSRKDMEDYLWRVVQKIERPTQEGLGVDSRALEIVKPLQKYDYAIARQLKAKIDKSMSDVGVMADAIGMPKVIAKLEKAAKSSGVPVEQITQTLLDKGTLNKLSQLAEDYGYSHTKLREALTHPVEQLRKIAKKDKIKSEGLQNLLKDPSISEKLITLTKKYGHNPELMRRAAKDPKIVTQLQRLAQKYAQDPKALKDLLETPDYVDQLRNVVRQYLSKAKGVPHDPNAVRLLQNLADKKGIDYKALKEILKDPAMLEAFQDVKKGHKMKMGLIEGQLQDPVSPTTRILNYFPHFATHQGRRSIRKAAIPGGVVPKELEAEKRVLQTWVDPWALREGKIEHISGQRPGFGNVPVVGKSFDPRTGVSKRMSTKGNPNLWHYELPNEGQQLIYVPEQVNEETGKKIGGYFRQYGHKYKRVEPIPSSIEEIETVYPHLKNVFMKKPVETFQLHTNKMADRIGMLNSFDELRNATIRTKVKTWTPRGEQLVDADVPLLIYAGPDKAALPEGYRRLKIKGMEDMAAQGVLANRFENKARVIMDPSSMIGSMEKAIGAMQDNIMGDAYLRFNRTWSTEVLSKHPGFYSANALTDLMLAWTAGVNKLPQRLWEAWKILRGSDKTIVKGIPNEFIKRGAQNFKVTGTGFQQSMAQDMALRAAGPSAARGIAGRLGTGGTGEKVGSGLVRLEQANDQLNNWLFSNVGGNLSDLVRLSVFIDQLKKAQKAGNKIDDLVMNRAAQYTKAAMIDYGDMSPFIQHMKGVMPFVTWYQGIVKRYMKDLVTKPERLWRAGKIVDTVFDPLPNEDREIAAEWTKEQSPVTGVFGTPLGKLFGREPGENPLYWGMSRFMPYGTIDQLRMDPLGNTWEAVAPGIRGWADLFRNKQSWIGKEVDPLAESAPGMLTGPITDPSGVEAGWTPAWRKFFGMNIPAGVDYLQRTFNPFSRTLNEIQTMGQSVSQALGHPIWQDPRNPTLSIPESAAWLTLGGKLQEFDRIKSIGGQYWKFREKLNKIKQQVNQAKDYGQPDRVLMHQLQWNKLNDEFSEFKKKYAIEIAAYKGKLKERKEKRKSVKVDVKKKEVVIPKETDTQGTEITNEELIKWFEGRKTK
jgi:hypothetical protein